MKKTFAFTLAEMMIVLALLGTIAAVIIPTIYKARPDETRLRFKKAYYTLQRTTDAVLNSDAYPQGDLSEGNSIEREYDAEGNLTTRTSLDENSEAVKFCTAFADMLNTIGSVNCGMEFARLLGQPVFYDDATGISPDEPDAITLDNICNRDASANYGDDNVINNGAINADGTITANHTDARFTTQDGIKWWGFEYDFSDPRVNQTTNLRADYSVVCVDVADGSLPRDFDSLTDEQKEEIYRRTIFGFGVRNDGKIIIGQRAQEMLSDGAARIE